MTGDSLQDPIPLGSLKGTPVRYLVAFNLVSSTAMAFATFSLKDTPQFLGPQ